jgi:hypothetical protein
LSGETVMFIRDRRTVVESLMSVGKFSLNDFMRLSSLS